MTTKIQEYYDKLMSTPDLIDPVYDIIREVPGVDAPSVCLQLLIDEGPSNIYHYPLQELSGAELARWCMEQRQKTWNKTCLAVDWLLEHGRITFSDDGELNCVY